MNIEFQDLTVSLRYFVCKPGLEYLESSCCNIFKDRKVLYEKSSKCLFLSHYHLSFQLGICRSCHSRASWPGRTCGKVGKVQSVINTMPSFYQEPFNLLNNTEMSLSILKPASSFLYKFRNRFELDSLRPKPWNFLLENRYCFFMRMAYADCISIFNCNLLKPVKLACYV